MNRDDRINKAILSAPNFWDVIDGRDSSTENAHELPLDEALNQNIPSCKCFNYLLEIGGEIYVGFTTQDPQVRLEQHIHDAKLGSKQRVHVALRRFGYLCHLEILGEYDNEILGLVAEISNIKKYRSTLNASLGGEGNYYEVFEKLNQLNEMVFFVRKKINKNPGGPDYLHTGEQE